MGFEDEYGGNELDPKMWDSDNDWYFHIKIFAVLINKKNKLFYNF